MLLYSLTRYAIFGLLVLCAPVAIAEVFVSGETHGGKKVTLRLDYNSYGAGDVYRGAVLTVVHPGGRVDKISFDKEEDGDEGNSNTSSEHAVQLLKVKGKWQLMVMFKARWENLEAELEVRYLAQNFDDKPAPKQGIRNEVNRLKLTWPEKGLKGIVLRELTGRGVPGDEWELGDASE